MCSVASVVFNCLWPLARFLQPWDSPDKNTGALLQGYIYICIYVYVCIYIYIYIYMINFVSWIQYWTIWYKWDYFLEIGDANSKEYAYQYRKPKRCGLIPGSGWAPGIGNGKPTPIFLPGKFHRQKNLAGSVHRVAKSRTQLGDWAQQSCFS